MKMFLDGQSMFLAFLNYFCRWFNLWYHWTFSEIGKEVGQTGLHSGVVVCTPTLHGSKSQLGPFYADILCSPGTCVGSSHGPKIYFIGSLVNLIEKWTWWAKKKKKRKKKHDNQKSCVNFIWNVTKKYLWISKK